MEFAGGLALGKASVHQCVPLSDAAMEAKRESLEWLMHALGLDHEKSPTD